MLTSGSQHYMRICSGDETEDTSATCIESPASRVFTTDAAASIVHSLAYAAVDESWLLSDVNNASAEGSVPAFEAGLFARPSDAAARHGCRGAPPPCRIRRFKTPF
jgi:hypothetical protein